MLIVECNADTKYIDVKSCKCSDASITSKVIISGFHPRAAGLVKLALSRPAITDSASNSHCCHNIVHLFFKLSNQKVL